MESFRLDGRIALITGGASGLGFGTAKAMTEAGARVVLVGRREEELKRACAELGDTSVYRRHDVRETQAAEALAAELEESVGPVDILVNNAGVHLKRTVVETSVDDFNRVLQTHLFGAYALTHAFAPRMTARRRGHILFISSMAAFMAIPEVVAYSAAKSAFHGLVKGLVADLSPTGVRVNAIAPGWIESEMLHQALDADMPRRERILGRTPLGRFGEPRDIGRAAVYLSSDAGSFITGVVLPVDGGASIGF